MIRHLFIVAWRHAEGNRVQSAIAVLGLTVGMTAALLMALAIHNQLSFDHFISGYARTYLLVTEDISAGHPAIYFDGAQMEAAPLLRLNAADKVESATRLQLPPSSSLDGGNFVDMKRGNVSGKETIYWADANVFDVLSLPVIQGDLSVALKQPNGIVLPRSIAHKYFGSDQVVGQTIELNGEPMTVRAVVEDLPISGTSLKSGIFASGLAAFSPMARYRYRPNSIRYDTYTFLRLKPGISPESLQGKFPDLARNLNGIGLGIEKHTLHLVRIDELPLFDGLHPGAKERLSLAGLVGLLILFIAAVNFVNLLTVRATRRALDVGVRKVCGAGRRSLILQFLSESVLTVLLAACLAVALSEWLLPTVNAFLATAATLDYWHDPLVLAALVATIAMLGVAAGSYPAFMLSSFRPINVLKGIIGHSRTSDNVRTVLVVMQFAILVILMVASAVVYQQHLFVTRDGLRINLDRMLAVQGDCTPVFRDELRKLPGVSDVACAEINLLKSADFASDTLQLSPVIYRGQKILFGVMRTDWNMFSLYGIKPIAGSLGILLTANGNNSNVTRFVVLNETAVKKLGFASPDVAIGQNIPSPGQPPGSGFTRIAAVVPDFSFRSVEQAVEPIAYLPNPIPEMSQANIKLTGERISETLAVVDRIWTATGHSTPIDRFFVDQRLQNFHTSLLRQAELFAFFSGVGIFLSCIGLLGLSISIAERRTKEIGIRKAMGADSAGVVRLLLWQFSKPILWANLAAWPVAFYLMSKWLNGFAHHVNLSLWLFPAAGCLALVIALLAVMGQALLVARQKPVLALRYE